MSLIHENFRLGSIIFTFGFSFLFFRAATRFIDHSKSAKHKKANTAQHTRLDSWRDDGSRETERRSLSQFSSEPKASAFGLAHRLNQLFRPLEVFTFPARDMRTSCDLFARRAKTKSRKKLKVEHGKIDDVARQLTQISIAGVTNKRADDSASVLIEIDADKQKLASSAV